MLQPTSLRAFSLYFISHRTCGMFNTICYEVLIWTICEEKIAKHIHAVKIKEIAICSLSRTTYSDASSPHMQHFKFSAVHLIYFISVFQ